MDLFGLDKEIVEVKDKLLELEILMKLLISTQIRNNALKNNKNKYDFEIDQITIITNLLQEKLNKSKR